MRRQPNHAAIVVAAVVLFVEGGIWFTVFDAPWLAAVGKSHAEIQAAYGPLRYVVALIAAWFVAYALDRVVALTAEPVGVVRGAGIGFLLGLNVFAAMIVTIDFFEARPLALIALDAGYGIVGITLAGVAVGAVRSRAARRVPVPAA